MHFSDHYDGSNDPFEGDLTVYLRGLPIGAHATKATVKLTPVAFAKDFLFDSSTGAGETGVTRDPSAQNQATYWAIADLHARRTISAIIASREQDQESNPPVPVNDGRVSVQIELGGTWAGVASDGTILTAGKPPLILRLPLTPTSATGSLPISTALPALSSEKIKLTAVSDNIGTVNTSGKITLFGLTIRSVPTNINVRLDQMPSFWFRLGELAVADTSSDFAELLNAFLLTAPSENGYYHIPFVIHSDTIARLDIELNIDYVIEQAVLPPHLTEINLPYTFSTQPGIDETLSTVKLPREAIPVSGRTGAQIQGQFQPTRIAQGLIGEEPEVVFSVEVSPECSLAQAILVDREDSEGHKNNEIEVIGIDLPLGKTQSELTGLNVAIRADDDGKPASDVLASAEVKIAKPLPGQSTWGTATLATPFRVLPSERYWLILQSRDNIATWNAITEQSITPADATLPLQCSRDGGLSWRAATAPGARQKKLSALLRLRDKPDRFSIPVQLQIGKGPTAIRRTLEEYAPLGKIEFNFDFAERLAEHLAKPELASPCGTGELIINGSFDGPRHDDATRRLFGFDVGFAGGHDSSLNGTVDLSRGVDLTVERYIALAVSGKDQLRIDCAGSNPVQTSLAEVIRTINQAVGISIASGESKLQVTDKHGVKLLPWQQGLVPDGWWLPGESGGQIGRAKLLPSDVDSDIGTVSERVGATLAVSENEIAMLAQTVPVIEGCAYSLNFLYQYQLVSCVDFRDRLVSTGPNPFSERGVTFTAFEQFDQPDSPAGETPVKKTSIDDLDRGVRGLNCSDKLTVELPYKCKTVELTISAGVTSVDVLAYEEDEEGRKPHIIVLNTDDQIPWMLKVTGANIYKIEVVTGTRLPDQTDTLLHKICFEVTPDIQSGASVAQHLSPLSEIRWFSVDGQLIAQQNMELDIRNSKGEARLIAPSGAVHAEIRFVQPTPGVLFLDDVSFLPTLEGLVNTRFHVWELDAQGQPTVPLGWMRSNGWVDQGNYDSRRVYIKLSGAGPEDAVLMQTIASVDAGKPYELRVTAHPEPLFAENVATRSVSQRTRLELHWLDNDKQIGEPVILPLDRRDFPKHGWSGIAPANATQAEIRLIQPKDKDKGNLIVKSVSLMRVDLVDVPLTFLAEAPGELNISNLRVTYDLSQPPEEEFSQISSSAQPARSMSLMRELRSSESAVQPARAVCTVTAGTMATPSESLLAQMPANIVAGVGQRFSKILSTLSPPVTTIAELAALDPQIEIKGIPPERQLELKTAAEMILAIDFKGELFDSLGQEQLDTLLTLEPSILAKRAGRSITDAEQFQRGLRALRLLIKNDEFQNLHLADLISPSV